MVGTFSISAPSLAAIARRTFALEDKVGILFVCHASWTTGHEASVDSTTYSVGI